MWTSELENAFTSARPGFDVHELLPLSKSDVAQAARANDLDPERFLAEVRTAGAVAFALRPLTLNLLIGIAREHGHLPSEPAELFGDGLLVLANEHDTQRAEDRQPIGSPEQRLAVAARLAAGMMVAGAGALSREPSAGGSDLMLGGFGAGTETIDSGAFIVTPGLVQATVETALFEGRGPYRYRVVHASFAAYLTARYLVGAGLGEEQLRALLTRTSAIGRTGVPTQLRETAAWLVALGPEKNRWLLHVDPVAVMSHTGYVTDPQTRSDMVAQLLSHADLATGLRWTRWHLWHPDLTDQLAPALCAPLTQDAGEDFGNRVSRTAATAIDIARSAGEIGVTDLLVDLATNTHLNPYLRSKAAHALLALDPQGAATSLSPLLPEVTAHPDHDPDDELRGVALEACLETLDAGELVRLLTRPQQSSFIGSYSGFLAAVAARLDDRRAVAVVQAIRALPTEAITSEGASGRNGAIAGTDAEGATAPAASPPYALTRRADRLLQSLTYRLASSEWIRRHHLDTLAWLIATCQLRSITPVLPTGCLEVSTTPDAPGKTTTRASATAGTAEEGVETRAAGESEDSQPLRRRLLLAAVSHMPADRAALVTRPVRLTEDPGPHGAGTPESLVNAEDFAWLLTQTHQLDPGLLRRLIRFSYDADLPDHQDIAYEHRLDPGLEWLQSWFTPVLLESSEADQMREHFELVKGLAWTGREEHARRLASLWRAIQEGENAAVPDLVSLLRVDPQTGDRPQAITDDDLTTWPGLDPALGVLQIDIDELAEACAQYLSAAESPPGEWQHAAGPISYAAVDHYAMLALLARRLRADEDLSQRLPAAAWERLTPVLVRRFHRDQTEDDPSLSLLRVLAQQAPTAMRQGYLHWVHDAVDANWDTVWPLWPLSLVYNHDVDEQLIAVLNTYTGRLCDLGPPPSADNAGQVPADSQKRTGLQDSVRRVLELLLEERTAAVSMGIGSDLLALAADTDQYCTPVRVQATASLLLVGGIDWPQVWHNMKADEDFARSLVQLIARWSTSRYLSALDVAELEELWRWLEERWPTSSDSWVNGPVGPDQMARDLRDEVLAQIARRASAAALHCLQRLAHDNPENNALHTRLVTAEAQLRDATWEGTDLQDLTAMVNDARSTVIHDTDALYRALLTALSDFEKRMHDLGHLLWNEVPDPQDPKQKLWRPKHEADLSAMLKDHLQQALSGLVVNREVMVRQTSSKGHGLAVDVLATAGVTDHEGKLPTCPVEVKGNWNDGLLEDLREQLVEDYMADLNTSHGIYLCGWFDVDLWTATGDYRRNQAKKHSREEVVASLRDAADSAALDLGLTVSVQVIDQ